MLRNVENGGSKRRYSLFRHYSRGGRRGDVMVSALGSGASGPGSSPGGGHYVVILGKTLNSHGASLHPDVCWGVTLLGDNPAMV